MISRRGLLLGGVAAAVAAVVPVPARSDVLRINMPPWADDPLGYEPSGWWFNLCTRPHQCGIDGPCNGLPRSLPPSINHFERWLKELERPCHINCRCTTEPLDDYD